MKEGDIIEYIDEDTIVRGILEKNNQFWGGWVVVSEGANVSYELIKKYIIEE